MILKREEKDGLISCFYDSSNILSSTYDKNINELKITFSSGLIYKYQNVDISDYSRFELADSQGKVFNTHIKKYPFEKLGDDLNAINESEKLKKEEKEKDLQFKQKALVDYIYKTISPTLIYISAEATFEKPQFKLDIFTEVQMDNLISEIKKFMVEIQ